MRNQRQSFYRFKPVVNLFAFAVLMAANSNLPAADPLSHIHLKGYISSL